MWSVKFSIKKIMQYVATVIAVATFVVLFNSERVFADNIDNKNGTGEIPEWVVWNNKSVTDCFSVDGCIRILLSDKALYFIKDNSVIWSSPKEYRVSDFMWKDIDNDNRNELMLLCWKIGRYGVHKPFWVDEDEKEWSQHIYIYEFENEKDNIRQKWMASDLGRLVEKWSIDKDNILYLEDIKGNTTLWHWDDFGLKNIEKKTISFVAVGDNLIHKPIYTYGLNNGSDFSYLYENVKDVISAADVAIINNETILVDDSKLYGTYPCFGTPVEIGDAVIDAGFDVMSCATNHSIDRGKTGVDTTIRFYDEKNVTHLGIQASDDQDEYKAYELYDANGMKVAFYNYTYGTNGIHLPKGCPNMVHLLNDEEKIRNDLAGVPEEADLIIVCVHWGTEYNTGIDSMQKKWSKIFNECGVDVVIGTHPHVLEPYEVITSESGNETLVYYSLGNFMSYQTKQPRVVGGMAKFTVEKTADGYKVSDYGMDGLVTHQIKGSGGKTTVYMLKDYNDELASEHVLGLTKEKAVEIYEAVLTSN